MPKPPPPPLQPSSRAHQLQHGAETERVRSEGLREAVRQLEDDLKAQAEAHQRVQAQARVEALRDAVLESVVQQKREFLEAQAEAAEQLTAQLQCLQQSAAPRKAKGLKGLWQRKRA